MLHIEKSIHNQIQNYDAIVTFSWRFIAYYEKNVLRVPLVVNRVNDTIRSRKSKKGIQCIDQKKKGMQYNDQKKKGMQYNGQKKKGIPCNGQKKSKNRTKNDLQITTEVT